jgi:hypothetical protein
MGTKSKKKKIPNYLKKSLKGTTIGGSAGVNEDEYVTVPSASLNLTKGNTTVSGGVAKPFSKFDKKNINSEMSLGISRETNFGGLSLTGTKSGKRKRLTFSFVKKLNTGGDVRGTGAAIRGFKFKGIF